METGTVRRAAAIHVLEHLYRWEAEATLREWIRILEPGGQLIIEVPCMDKVFDYIRQAMTKNGILKMQMVWWALWGDPRYEEPSMVHRWGYSSFELKAMLTGCGLEHVTEEPPRYHRADRDMRVTGRKGMGV